MECAPAAAYRHYLSYFEEFLPAFVGRRLLDEAQDLSCTFAYRLLDAADPPWLLTVESGRLCAVAQQGALPECTFVCEIDTLLDIVSGAISGQDAFFAKEVDIEGNLERGLILSTLLSTFFERYPFRP